VPSREEVPGSRGHKHDVAWEPAPPRPRPTPKFAEGLIFETDSGERVASIRFTPDEVKDWHFILGDRPHTNWFLASDFHTGTLYSVGTDGTVYDLRNQKLGAFTTSQIDSTDEWISLCNGCGVHSLSGPIQHLSTCKRPSARSLAPRRRKRTLPVSQMP
jgi:hypothetical protein